MYKNVLNWCIVALFLLFIACCGAFKVQTQSKGSKSSQIFADLDRKLVAKSDLSGNQPTTIKTNKTDPDTSWKPVRRIWGLAFGDFYYLQHADAAGRGGETNYAGIPANRNTFQFRRIYCGI